MNPMLCDKFTPEQAKELGDEWVLEQKYDGIRGYIENGKLYDRRGADITHKFPEFVGLGAIKDTIDGEIIAKSGRFNEISGRVHLKDAFVIKLSADKNPAVFVAFDVVNSDALEARRARLLALEPTFPAWLKVTPQFEASEFPTLWAEVLANGDEGLVAKKKGSFYEHRRSSSWRKIKSFVETEATFTKYERHTHGITIETVDGRRVNVNGAQAQKLIKLFEVGDVVCEIQYLPQHDSDAWRFPSYRGTKTTSEVKP